VALPHVPIFLLACVCRAAQLKVTCGALSSTGAASAVSSSSHVARLPQPSRDVSRLASRRLQHEIDRQWHPKGRRGGVGQRNAQLCNISTSNVSNAMQCNAMQLIQLRDL